MFLFHELSACLGCTSAASKPFPWRLLDGAVLNNETLLFCLSALLLDISPCHTGLGCTAETRERPGPSGPGQPSSGLGPAPRGARRRVASRVGSTAEGFLPSRALEELVSLSPISANEGQRVR